MSRYEKIELPEEIVSELFEQITGGAKNLIETDTTEKFSEKELLYSIDAFFIRSKSGVMELWVKDSAIRQYTKMKNKKSDE
jgi:hypothetical protein